MSVVMPQQRSRPPLVKPKIKLVLGVKRKLSRQNDPDADVAEAAFQEMRPRILMRDKHTCQACGFVSYQDKQAPGGFLEVHHIDDDHHNNTSNNLVTLCPFCHQVFTLGRRGDSFGGRLIWLPEMSQETLNILCHAMYAVMYIHNDEEIKLSSEQEESTAKIYDLHSALSDLCTQRLHAVYGDIQYFESIETLYSALSGLTMKEYERRNLFMGGVRILPDYAHFQEHIAFWAKNVWLKGVPPGNWASIVNQVEKALQGV